MCTSKVKFEKGDDAQMFHRYSFVYAVFVQKSYMLEFL